MNFSKFYSKAGLVALPFALAAACSLTACGDDSSSSGPSDPLSSSSGKPGSSTSIDPLKLVEELNNKMMELGPCTDKNQGEKGEIEILGKTFEVTCKAGDWDTSEIEAYLDELENELDESDFDPSDFDFDDGDDDSKEKCSFKVTDDTWMLNNGKTLIEWDGNVANRYILQKQNYYTEASCQQVVNAMLSTMGEAYAKNCYCEGSTFISKTSAGSDEMNKEAYYKSMCK